MSGKIEEVFRATFADEATTAMANPILYGDFLLYNEIEEQKNAGGGDLVRLYEDLTDYATIKPVLNEVRAPRGSKWPERLHRSRLRIALGHRSLRTTTWRTR